eukprot:148491-Prorocentrum_minimum.AAC.1
MEVIRQGGRAGENLPSFPLGPRGAQWEKVGNWTQGEKRGRISRVLSALLPLLAQEDQFNECPKHNCDDSRKSSFVDLPPMARLLCCAGVYTTTVLKRFNLAHKQNYHRMTELWTRYGVGYTAETHNKSQVYRCTHPDFLQ